MTSVESFCRRPDSLALNNFPAAKLRELDVSSYISLPFLVLSLYIPALCLSPDSIISFAILFSSIKSFLDFVKFITDFIGSIVISFVI